MTPNRVERVNAIETVVKSGNVAELKPETILWLVGELRGAWKLVEQQHLRAIGSFHKLQLTKEQLRIATEALEDYASSCRECHGQGEYQVLVYHGDSGPTPKQATCSTCTWARKVLEKIRESGGQGEHI